MSKRILRVNQLIQKELSKILLREVEFSSGVLVTITRVEASPNLNEAKIYISCLPEDKTPEVFQLLKRQVYHIQQILNKRLEMKVVPKIRFVKELKTKQAGRVEEILEKLKSKR